MLMACQQCSQVVQVAELNEHLLGECDGSQEFRYAPPLGVSAEYNGCPLCGVPVPPGVDAWRQHLSLECEGNPRRTNA